jgi:hypothetical protein
MSSSNPGNSEPSDDGLEKKMTDGESDEGTDEEKKKNEFVTIYATGVDGTHCAELTVRIELIKGSFYNTHVEGGKLRIVCEDFNLVKTFLDWGVTFYIFNDLKLLINVDVVALKYDFPGAKNLFEFTAGIINKMRLPDSDPKFFKSPKNAEKKNFYIQAGPYGEVRQFKLSHSTACLCGYSIRCHNPDFCCPCNLYTLSDVRCHTECVCTRILKSHQAKPCHETVANGKYYRLTLDGVREIMNTQVEDLVVIIYKIIMEKKHRCSL